MDSLESALALAQYIKKMGLDIKTDIFDVNNAAKEILNLMQRGEAK